MKPSTEPRYAPQGGYPVWRAHGGGAEVRFVGLGVPGTPEEVASRLVGVPRRIGWALPAPLESDHRFRFKVTADSDRK